MIAVKRKPTITELTRIILSSHPGGGGVNPAVALEGFSQQWIGVAIDLAIDPITAIHAVFFPKWIYSAWRWNISCSSFAQTSQRRSPAQDSINRT
jgi:hypothetical protein